MSGAMKNARRVSAVKVEGKPLTPRMRAFGITGMVSHADGWAIEANGLTLTAPREVGDWLADPHQPESPQ